jgi:hypothetical protein
MALGTIFIKELYMKTMNKKIKLLVFACITALAMVIFISWRGFRVAERTIATLHANFQGKTNVLQISPAGSDTPLFFSLREYAGQRITIEVSVQVWLERPAKVVWQIDNDDYPVIAGDYTTLGANQWHTVQGSSTVTVASSSWPILYLSNHPELLANVTA